MTSPPRDYTSRILRDLRAVFLPDVAASKKIHRVPEGNLRSWFFRQDWVGKSQTLSITWLRKRSWPSLMLSVLFHSILIGACVELGMLTTHENTTFPVVMTFSLGGPPGPDGLGGDGQVMGSSAAAGAAAQPPTLHDENIGLEPQTSNILPVAGKAPAVAMSEHAQPPKEQPKPKTRIRVAHKTRPKPTDTKPSQAETPPSQMASSDSSGTTTGIASGQDTGAVGNGSGKGPWMGEDKPGSSGNSKDYEGTGNGTERFGQGNGPRFRRRCLPLYPSENKMENKEGCVILRLTIDESGDLRDLVVIKHDGPEFVREAVQAIRSSTFYPATVQGNPVKCRALLIIRFKLS